MNMGPGRLNVWTLNSIKHAMESIMKNIPENAIKDAV